MRILYVENHETFARTVIAEFVQDHVVTVASSLVEALAKLDVEPFDALLVDYDLEDGKGDEFVRKIRERGSRVPIVASSAHDEGNAALLKAGADVVCAKSAFRGIGGVLEKLMPSDTISASDDVSRERRGP
jgi:DNA-binding response OmpR family regulator